MPRLAKELSPLEVRNLMRQKQSGQYPVGGVPGLLLEVRESGSAYWHYRTHIAGKRRWIGIGGYPEFGLGDAREEARELRRKVRDGYDPISERRERKASLREEQRQQITFRDHWHAFMAVKRKDLTKKSAKEWDSIISTYALPIIGTMLVKDVGMHDIKSVLVQPVEGGTLWDTKNPTAKKLRKRLFQAFNNARAEKRYSGDNPAEWRGNLDGPGVLPKPSAVHKERHYPSLPFVRAPEFIVELKKRGGNAALALELTILTAVRSEMAIGATWEEIDLDKAQWRIPAERMKTDEDHNAPLSEAAIALLESLPREDELIFPAPRGGKMSGGAMLALVKRMHSDELQAGREGWVDPTDGRRIVPHGFRSTFKDWCTEETDVQDFISELALAHVVGNEVRQAYQRSDLLAKRRGLMREWAAFLGYPEQGAKVVHLEARA